MDNSITNIKIETGAYAGSVDNGVNNIGLTYTAYVPQVDEKNISCINVDHTRCGVDMVMFV